MRSDSDAQVEPGLDAGAATDPHVDASPDLSGDDAGSLDASDAQPVAANDASARPDAFVAPVVCGTRDPVDCPTPPTRYRDVQPIFEQRCVICHSPLWTGPWPLDAYSHVAEWQDTIRDVMLDCSMPLPDAGVPITLDERQQILSFIRCGLPM